MTFTVHRGTHEIGGTCIEINAARSRLVVDIGMPLMNSDGSPFTDDVRNADCGTLVAKKILPDIPSLYGKSDGKETALLISHAHQDHYGLVQFVDSSIPIYLGWGTHKLIKMTAVFTCKHYCINNPKHFKHKDKIIFGDFIVIPYLQDHSCFDSYGFLIQAEGASLFYSGDFRSNGRKSLPTKKNPVGLFGNFLHSPPKADYLLLEGTTLSRDNYIPETEEQIQQRFSELFDNTYGINLVYVSGQNIDRLVTLYKARGKKILVLDIYTAIVLSVLAEKSHENLNLPERKNVRIFYPKRLTRRIEKGPYAKYAKKLRPREISIEEIDQNAPNIVMTVRPTIDEVESLKNLSGGNIIFSMWHGYKESPDTADFLSRLKEYGMQEKEIHTSGHADRETLKQFADAINPKKIVPVHTMMPGEFKTLFGDKVLELGDGETVEL